MCLKGVGEVLNEVEPERDRRKFNSDEQLQGKTEFTDLKTDREI